MKFRLYSTAIIIPLLLAGYSLKAGNAADSKYEIKTVVIDAGHGGHDPGCLGSTVYEKKIALAIALKVGGYIEKYFPDVKVVYTRKTDIFIELHERAAIANRNKADLFISIHCNAGPSKVFGTETYVMGLHKSNDNLNVAKRENEVILMEENYAEHYDGFDPNSPEAHIIFSLYQNAYIDQSISLASKIQHQFENRAKRSSRGVRQAGFLVLYKTAMPSVLIETGFLTNKNEEKYLKTALGQDYISSAIYRAFKAFKLEMEGLEAANLTADKSKPKPLINDIQKPSSVSEATGESPKEATNKAGQADSKTDNKPEIKVVEPAIKGGPINVETPNRPLNKEKTTTEQAPKNQEQQQWIARQVQNAEKNAHERDWMDLDVKEAERIARERAESQQSKTPPDDLEANAAKEKAEAERVAKEKAEAERIAKEKAKAERIAKEKAKAERIAKEKAEAERIAKEKAEAERIAKEKAEAERIAKEKAEAERIAKEKAEAERIAKEKAEADRIAKEKAEAERIAKEKAEAERIAKEKAEAERIAKEKAEAERIAKEKAEAERIAKEKAEAERIAKEKAEAERIAKEKAEAERIAKEKAEAERIAKEKAEAERIAKEKAEAERIAKEKAEAERIAKEKAEAERIAKEKAEAERIAKEKAEAERIAKEKAEAERIAKEKADLADLPTQLPVFRVQIGISNTPLDPKLPKFAGLHDFYYDQMESGGYKNLVGAYQTLAEAIDFQKSVRLKGFKDAFIVPYLGDERITMKEAINMLKK